MVMRYIAWERELASCTPVAWVARTAYLRQQEENEGERGEVSEEISADVRAQGGVEIRRQEEEAAGKIAAGQFGKGAQVRTK